MMESLSQILPVLVSFILGLVVYLVKAIISLLNKVLVLEVKIETLIREVERIRCDKENFEN